jgi:predicted RNA-binding protein with RPS1 domain
MDVIIENILKYGLGPAFLMLVIILIIQDPNRAYKLKVLVLRPFFKLFNWFKRSYISAEVAGHVNSFLSRELAENTSKIKIKWIRNENDPIFKNGELIVRMKRDDDQTKNILNAARFALPKIVLPVFRHYISTPYASAIDFTYLNKLADKLGNDGRSIFKQFYLNPEISSDPVLSETFKKLVKIDKYGIFTSIFINELEYIGKGLFADSDNKDRTNELIEFINYLCILAERDIGEEIELMHFSEIFNVSTILLAKSITANRRGLIPYLRRLNINIEKGSDSIYIVAFPNAFDFLSHFLKVLDGNQRVSISHHFKIKDSEINKRKTTITIACLRRNKLYTNESFERKIDASQISVGKIVNGVVIDCSIDESLISFLGVEGTIRKSECSWFSFQNCADVLNIGESKQFIITAIDKSNGHISLSLKTPESNPWNKIEIPQLGSKINVRVVARNSLNLKCVYLDLLEINLPLHEISWFEVNDQDADDLIGSEITALITAINESEMFICCSIRQLDSDPWEEIHQSLKVGTEFNGKVHEVNEHFIRVDIGRGFIGKIPKEYLYKAGFEYARFNETMVVGQGIDVYVSKVFLKKKWIRLDLKRNLDTVN